MNDNYDLLLFSIWKIKSCSNGKEEFDL